MTIIDLRTLSDKRTVREYEVCIVGAGAAGLYLARRLVVQGNRVAVLEAGGDTCFTGADVGVETGFLADTYGGAVDGRAFGVGGTTSLWGGQLLPYSTYDERSNSKAWFRVVDLVQRHSSAVYSELGLGSDGHHFSLAQEYLDGKLSTLTNSELAVLVSDWLPFRRRNLRFLIDKMGKTAGRLDVYTNAVATSWLATQQSEQLARVESVIAVSINGRELKISAKKFVIAAGAIESARILLELFVQSGRESVAAKHSVGHYLSDHLSAPVAKVEPADRKRVALMFGPRFRNGRMRSFRFVDRQNNESRQKGFFHFVFLQENPGFHLARKVLGGLQAHRIPKLSVAELLGGIRGISGLAYARYVQNRLFIPPDTPIQLQFDIEQIPRYDNYLALSNEKDGYGRLKANIHWKVSPEDYENLECASRKFLEHWPSQDFEMPALTPINSVGVNGKLYDTYHPVGTCRMGENNEAVVNYDLQVYGLANVYLASTGVFPSAGTANPTFSLLCMAEALAVRLGKIDK